MRSRLAVMGLALCVMALGCLNPFAKTYQASLTGDNYRMGLEHGNVELVRTDDADKSVSEWLAKAPSWVVVGNSAWRGQDWLEDQAIDQAKAVGATLVYIESKKLNSQLAYLPVATLNSSVTSSSGSINTPSGSGTYSGTSVTYGTQNTYVPYERVTMEVKAYFLAMRKPKATPSK